jgi:uncharacterized protein YndB with AHSA1/START domain
MSHFQRSLVLQTSPATVYAALTTSEGLRSWWTQDCDVATEVGGTIRLRFGCSQKDMRIERLAPGSDVCWLCTGARIASAEFAHQDEWVGTRLVFRLVPHGQGRTRLDFEHIGLVPALDCYGLCSDGWRHYLGSLQQLVETGRGTPFRLVTAAAT